MIPEALLASVSNELLGAGGMASSDSDLNGDEVLLWRSAIWILLHGFGAAGLDLSPQIMDMTPPQASESISHELILQYP